MRYGLLNDVRVLDKAAFPLMVQRYVALAYDKGRIQRRRSAAAAAVAAAAGERRRNRRHHRGFQPDRQPTDRRLRPGAEFGPANAGRTITTRRWLSG